MKIGIIGTGAMASLFAARLHSAADVTMIGTWQAQIDAINQHGLTVHELDGSTTQHQIVATSDLASVAAVDVALVLTKSYQTIEAVERVAAVLAPDGVVVTLQNGLGNLEHFVAVFGRNRCTVGVTSLGATLIQRGTVRHAGNGDVQLAIPPDASPLFTQFAEILRTSGISLHAIPDANALLWSKVAINAGINPLTALLSVSNGRLVEDVMLRPVMFMAAREAASVAAALGIKLAYDDVAVEVERVAEATATNRSSMLQDITRGAPTEIDAICGAIMRAGLRTQTPTPINAALYQAIIALESGEKPTGWAAMLTR